ncbi:zinc finger protein 618-like [Conger conger]|uniref:zinc finger protein 618-like n=1 Tax=Conger conger TaxID=82655 RepID=UPI002A5B05CF|nr:zinc finger protein 618-like [Conger conger]
MSTQEGPSDEPDQGESGSVQETPDSEPVETATQGSPTAAEKAEAEAGSATPSNGQAGDSSLPAEICVVIGGSRNTQTLGSYVCGICGKKYKYYNCYQTHVRAHSETEGSAREGVTPSLNSSFRYACDICGKKYKYYSCFQEHRDLHAVDDPYDQVVIPVDDQKDEEQVEPFQKVGPKTGSYVCEYCGKQYKYFNPYQEHVALHTPINRSLRDLQSPRSQQRSGDVSKHVKTGHPKSGPNQTESAFCRKMEGKIQTSVGETNSSQNSGGTKKAMVPASFPVVPKPYTCGACGIQFQFYNNLLEHMQSHAADNENHINVDPPRISPAPPAPAPTPTSAPAPTPSPAPTPPAPTLPAQRNHATNRDSILPEKDRQQVAERLLRVMCADLGVLNVLSGKDFLKLAQTLVDTGARHGAYSLRDALGDMSSLALRQLPRMYNQVKVKVTCALGSGSSLGIAVTCHSHAVGPDACYVLTAYQAEGSQVRRYVLGVKEADLREAGDSVHQWVQNVLSEFVMSEIRTIYVTEPRVSGVPFCGRAGACLRCAGCSLAAVVQAVLGKRSLQARGLQELGELMATCRDVAAVAGLTREAAGGEGIPEAPPPCWDEGAETLLLVHEQLEQLCEAFGRGKRAAPILQGLNKPLLGTLASLLAPLRQAVLELSSERRPTLPLVLPAYLRLEKLYTSKAGESGTGGRVCHYFLEALKENLRVERPHQVAMVLDPQLKLRPVPTHQHDEIMAKVCEAAGEMREAGGAAAVTGDDGGGGGAGEGPAGKKRPRLEGGAARADEPKVRKELFQYLAEPTFHAAPDLLQYWSSAAEKFPRLARLALWLLAVPAVGTRSDCAAVCQQTLAMKNRRQVRPEEANKLIFLKSNMA